MPLSFQKKRTVFSEQVLNSFLACTVKQTTLPHDRCMSCARTPNCNTIHRPNYQQNQSHIISWPFQEQSIYRKVGQRRYHMYNVIYIKEYLYYNQIYLANPTLLLEGGKTKRISWMSEFELKSHLGRCFIPSLQPLNSFLWKHMVGITHSIFRYILRIHHTACHFQLRLEFG